MVACVKELFPLCHCFLESASNGGGGDATVEFSSRLRLRIINDTGEGGGGGSCILILLFSVERRWAGQVMGAISLTGTGAPWA